MTRRIALAQSESAPAGVLRRAWQRCRDEWRTILLLPATPHQIALGVAVGVFVSVTPTPGCQMVLAGLLAALVGGSVRAALPMVFLSNPLTAAPILWITYEAGRLCWPWAPRLSVTELVEVFTHSSASLSAMLDLGLTLVAPLVIGGLLVGAVLGALSYPLMLVLLRQRGRVAAPVIASSPEAATVSVVGSIGSPRRAA